MRERCQRDQEVSQVAYTPTMCARKTPEYVRDTGNCVVSRLLPYLHMICPSFKLSVTALTFTFPYTPVPALYHGPWLRPPSRLVCVLSTLQPMSQSCIIDSIIQWNSLLSSWEKAGKRKQWRFKLSVLSCNCGRTFF